MSVFDAYAQYYDILYRDKDYSAESDYVSTLMNDACPQAVNLLELGSGTGLHAIELARKGYALHGIDYSERMVDLADERCKALDQSLSERISFATGDIRTWRSDEQYDAVLSLFHVFSYQNSNADVTAALNTAATHLRAGGVLIFDFWYGPAVLCEMPEVRIKRFENEEYHLTRLAEPQIHFNRNIVDVNYEVLVRNKASNVSQTINETHSMRYFFMPEIELLLEKTGFSMLDSFGWMTDRTPDNTSWAAVVIAQKS